MSCAYWRATDIRRNFTAYEKTRLVERTKAALIRAKEEDGLEIQGKMRDLVAAMINESSTNSSQNGRNQQQ